MHFFKVGYLAALALLATAPVVAQTVRDPADTLSMHLRSLAANPRDYAALLGAGQSALEVGDPNAALGFFARAEELAPRDGRAKAGLGSALVMMERPDDALRLFSEAVSLGTPEELVARDRGLAYDLRGDNRRAQKDYVLALKRGPDDEATRRYALSLGISGDRAQALSLLDPLLRRKDQGAWRARAFVMAMTGDVNGADAIARAVMPTNMAGTMTPFLKRLASLNAADRAHAVNFGTMPSRGQSFAAVALGDPYKPAGTQTANVGDTLIPAGEPLGPRALDAAPARVVESLSRAPRRRPGKPVETASAMPAPGFSVPPSQTAMARTGALSSGPLLTARVGERVGARIAPVDPARLPPEARGQGAVIASVVHGDLPPPSGARVMSGPPAERPAFETAPTSRLVAPKPVVLRPDPIRVAAASAPGSRLAAILAGVIPEKETAPVALPTIEQQRAAQKAARRKAADAAAALAAEQAAKEAKAVELAAARVNPARLWVQIATGNNESGLPLTWRRIRDANAEALKNRSAWSAPYKATNRLLVGPMKSPADARALVSALAKGGVKATTFDSEVGQEVARVGGK